MISIIKNIQGKNLPCIIIGMIALAFFAGPLIVGIINIGNAGGILISLALLTYGFKAPQIKKALGRAWKSKVKRVVIIICSVIAFAIVVLTVVISGFIISKFYNLPPKNTNAIVLGCGVEGSNPSLMLLNRINAAEKYLIDNPMAKAILSGGQGNDEDISEAKCMYNVLTERGISPDRLIIEDRSTSTEENLAFSKEISEKEGMEDSVVIITNGFHQYRSTLLAERQGFTVYNMSCRETTLFPTYFVREIFGVLYYWMQG